MNTPSIGIVEVESIAKNAHLPASEKARDIHMHRPHSALGYLTPTEFAACQNPKWAVVSKDLNNPAELFTTGPARADRFSKTVSPAPVDNDSANVREQWPQATEQPRSRLSVRDVGWLHSACDQQPEGIH